MSLRILVVDDEVPVLRLFKNMVEPLGYEVLALEDSREAVKRLERDKFDGFVLDVHMPHLDGYELTRRVRASALNRHAPIVLVTGMNDLDAMRKGFTAGATFFLNKPFAHDRVHSLFTAVRGAMMRERRRHARLPLRTSVRCTFGPGGEKNFVASSVNVAEGGILLEPSGGLEVGQELAMEFSLPQLPEPQDAVQRALATPGSEARPRHQGPLKVRGRVVRREPPDRVGLQFLSLSAEELDVIQRYIMGAVKM